MSLIRTRSFTKTACLAIAGIAVSALVLGGCQDARTATATGLSKTSKSLYDMKVELNDMNKSLVKIKKGDDLKVNYAAFKDQMDDATEHAQAIKSDYEEITTKTDEVIAAWKQEIVAVKDPTLLSSSTERSAKVQTAVTEIAADFGRTKDAYKEYVTSLNELTKFLDTDLTDSGVKVAGPALDKTIKAGNTVQDLLHVLSGKFDALSGEISPTVKE